MLSFSGAILFLVCCCSRNSRTCCDNGSWPWLVLLVKRHVDRGLKTQQRLILKAKEVMSLFHVGDCPVTFLPRVIRCVTCSERD